MMDGRIPSTNQPSQVQYLNFAITSCITCGFSKCNLDLYQWLKQSISLKLHSAIIQYFFNTGMYCIGIGI